MMKFALIYRPFSSLNMVGNKKISPAAIWHATVLKIDLNEVVGTGPKGHILKSDILSFKSKQIPKNTLKFNEEFALIFETIPPLTSETVIQKCINKSIGGHVDKIEEMNFKFIPEIGFLQVKLKGSGIDGEKIKNLLKLYLNDFRRLLL